MMAEDLEYYKTWYKGFLDDLDFSVDTEGLRDFIKITPKQYLGSEKFAKIAEITKDHNGEYVSKGKESHFRIYLMGNKVAHIKISFDSENPMHVLTKTEGEISTGQLILASFELYSQALAETIAKKRR